MSSGKRLTAGIAAISVLFLALSPAEGFAQGREKVVSNAETIAVFLTPEMKLQVRGFYADKDMSGVKPLPPGIRKRLARGKALPPGIAMTRAPDGLRRALSLPSGYELVEIGLDVVLVEVATQVVHDVLKDVFS
jgi:hypothetical protein